MTNTNFYLSPQHTEYYSIVLYQHTYEYIDLKRVAIAAKVKSSEKSWAKIISNLRYCLRDQPFYLFHSILKTVKAIYSKVEVKWFGFWRGKMSKIRLFLYKKSTRKLKDRYNYKKGSLFIKIPNSNYCDTGETRKLNEYFVFYEDAKDQIKK